MRAGRNRLRRRNRACYGAKTACVTDCPGGFPQIGSAVVLFTRSIAKRPVTFRSAGTAATKRR